MNCDSSTFILSFVNDLPEVVTSKIYMFADDTKLYKWIKNVSDCQCLQNNIDNLVIRSNQWKLLFNRQMQSDDPRTFSYNFQLCRLREREALLNFSKVITSTQSNLRRAHCSLADKTNSKLLGSHSPSMLTVRFRSCIWPPRSVALLLLSHCRCCICFVTFFLFNPHFDLEPDYIIRKAIRHRIQRYTVHAEILSTFHTRVKCIS